MHSDIKYIVMWGGKSFLENFIFFWKFRKITGDNIPENFQYFSKNLIVDYNNNNNVS